MNNNVNLPSLSNEGSLTHYLQQIKKFPMLSQKEEISLARKWIKKGDTDAAHKLVTSHLRLVARIAMGYKGYGLPITELISEGNIGLMQAVKKYDPEKGFRLSTYAMWWIRAAIQEYVLKSWSLVKIGTTAAQKKLFFNLKKIKNQLTSYNDGSLKPDQVKEIAERLDVTEAEVSDMEGRMSGTDYSLNAVVSEDGVSEWQDWLVDEDADQEVKLAEREELSKRKSLLSKAINILNEREQNIISARKLSEVPKTLEELSKTYKISRERVRQIEEKAFAKLQLEMVNLAKETRLIPA
ncbi:MAG: RNA polymerase sigma factor RpoH [Candidatus Pelagibacterales bacterium]|jgi:RNA polymerase sigma-32 factor|nr:RNA polymerase sigma factor RpoH [Pelagibacterales bacterium]MDB4220332.1 RNA polymerase sigma factor RpoH [Pelagibacterales bacterium]MDB9818548.1 RNA polymerase sigma factor RpoH [Pelagibacterales bacterium]|tara:strand:- start:5251 stop:6138 length:888 start_codon:yes stop_codon:yes gene_type:complete